METGTSGLHSYLSSSDVTTRYEEKAKEVVMATGGGFSPIYIVIILPCSVILVIITIIAVYVGVTRLNDTVQRRKDVPGDCDCWHPTQDISPDEDDSLSVHLAMTPDTEATEMVAMTPAKETREVVAKTTSAVSHSQLERSPWSWDAGLSHTAGVHNGRTLILPNNVAWSRSHSNDVRTDLWGGKADEGCIELRQHSQNDAREPTKNKLPVPSISISMDSSLAKNPECAETGSLTSDDREEIAEDRKLLTTPRSSLQNRRSLSLEVLELGHMKDRNKTRRSSSARGRSDYLDALAQR